MKNQRKKNGEKKKKGPKKSDVAGDMLDKGDKEEATAPTRHARPIKIKQRRRIKDHQSTQ